VEQKEDGLVLLMKGAERRLIFRKSVESIYYVSREQSMICTDPEFSAWMAVDLNIQKSQIRGA